MTFHKSTLALGVLLVLMTACKGPDSVQNSFPLRLWYDEAATDWEEALPLGNGRLGAMVFGGTETEHIQLNDDSMWPGDPDWEHPPGRSEDLAKLREMIMDGKIPEADQEIVELFSNKGITLSHQTLGDLYIDMDHGEITDYQRELDLRGAVSRVSYRTDGALFTEEVFVSAPHQAMVVHLRTEAPGGLSGRIRLSRSEDRGVPTAQVFTNEEKQLLMQGMVTQQGGSFLSEAAPVTEGVKFETCLQVDHRDGQVTSGEESLEMEGLREAIIYLVSNSSYYHEDYSAQNRKDLEAIAGLTLADLREAHTRDYSGLFDRVSLDLGGHELDSLTTDQRLERMKQEGADPALEALLFQYGRYLLISSSRPGTNPANLQGLWNEHIEAPWNGDYHLNINLQMNYWPANLTGLDELNMPLFDYLDRLVESGKETAQLNFGCRGSFLPHATDLWVPTWMRAATAYWGCSVGAGGWMMQHYWQHYEFTRDTAFLRDRALPAMKEVAQFYSDWLVLDPRDSTLVSVPSTSPENRYYGTTGEQQALCMGSAMDQQIIAEVFDNYLEACRVLDVSGPLEETIKDQRSRLRPGFVLGSDGRILEWDREYDEPEPGHRHMSHLYGFHPGTAVSRDHTPEIFHAVRRTLDYRLDHGGAGTGWSRAWLINCSARLLDGNMAHDHMQLLFTRSMYSNLFDAHPPFQIDGNFGFTAGMAEILLQSHIRNGEGIPTLDLLPALPDAYQEGYVSGLGARGGFSVSLRWSEGMLREVGVLSMKGNRLLLRYQGKMLEMETEAGKEYNFSLDDFT